MSDFFATSLPHGNRPVSEEDLRRSMAALLIATAQPSLSPDDFIAAVEAQKDAMLLPSPTAIGCVFFDSGGQHWGARLSDIDRIIGSGDIRPVVVPQSPPWLLGVFHIDIEIASLIDLSRFLNDAIAESRQRQAAVLVVRHADAIFALKVSRLSFTSMIEEHDLTFSAGDGATGAPYVLATYTPQTAIDSEAARAAGILDVRHIARAIDAELAQGAWPHV